MPALRRPSALIPTVSLDPLRKRDAWVPEQIARRKLAAGLIGAALALVALFLSGLAAAGWFPWRLLADWLGPPWTAVLLRPGAPTDPYPVAQAMARNLGLMGAAFLLYAGGVLALALPWVRWLAGDAVLAFARRIIALVAWIPMGAAAGLLWHLDPATLAVRFVNDDTVLVMVLPTILGVLAVGVVVLAIAPRPERAYLGRRLTVAARLAPAGVGAGVALAMDALINQGKLAGPAGQMAHGAARLWEGGWIEALFIQGMSWTVTAIVALAAAEALLALRARFRSVWPRRRALALLSLLPGLALLLPVTVSPLVGVRLALVGAGLPSASLLLDEQGRLLDYYHAAPGAQWRYEVGPDGISPHVYRALYATEDRGFDQPWRRPPVNLIRLAGLTLASRESGGGGGSGIPQQLCKNYSGQQERQQAAPGFLQRPVRLLEKALYEFPCGWALEQAALLTGRHQEAAAQYLNMMYFGIYKGESVYGIETAARLYFGKPAAQLDAHEAALLVRKLQRPSYYNPFANPGATEAGRATVLANMVEEGYLSRRAADQAARRDLVPRGAPFVPPGVPDSFLKGCLLPYLDANGLRNLSTGGYRITVTLDPQQQALLDRDLAAAVRRQAAKVNNGEAVLVDPLTQKMLACASVQPDAAGAPHQPGSTIKPLLYGVALDTGRLAPGEKLPDTPPADPAWSHNADLTGGAPLPWRWALERSRNVGAQELVQRLEPAAAARFLQERFGIRSDLMPGQYGVQLALGLSELPVAEVAAAYTALAAGGDLRAPAPLTVVRTRDGEVVHRPAGPRRALDARWAAEVADTLRCVSKRVGLPEQEAVKTGTTTGSSYAVGFGREFVLAVWLGRTEPGRGLLEIPGGLSGEQGALSVVGEYMRRLHQGLRLSGEIRRALPVRGCAGNY